MSAMGRECRLHRQPSSRILRSLRGRQRVQPGRSLRRPERPLAPQPVVSARMPPARPSPALVPCWIVSRGSRPRSSEPGKSAKSRQARLDNSVFTAAMVLEFFLEQAMRQDVLDSSSDAGAALRHLQKIRPKGEVWFPDAIQQLRSTTWHPVRSSK